MHLFRKLWQAQQIGLFPHNKFLRTALLHGISCQTCMYELQHFIAPASPEPEVVVKERYSPKEIEGQIAELQKLDQDERLERIKRARTRFRGVAFIRAALEEIGKYLHEPEEGAVWIECARTSLAYSQYSDASLKASYVLVCSMTGDLARRRGEIETANEEIERASDALESHFNDLRSPSVEVGRISSRFMTTHFLFKGYLSLELGDHQSAERQFLTARAMCRAAGNDDEIQELVEEHLTATSELAKRRTSYSLEELCLELLVSEEKADA